MTRITTTTQMKNQTIAGIAYLPTVLALAMAPSYPALPELFRYGALAGLVLIALIAARAVSLARLATPTVHVGPQVFFLPIDEPRRAAASYIRYNSRER